MPPPPLTPAQRQLAADPLAIDKARGMARHYARVYAHIDRDEFESAALLAVVGAARRFDGRGRFLGFCLMAVRRGLINVVRDHPPKGYRARDRRRYPRTFHLSAVAAGAAKGRAELDKFGNRRFARLTADPDPRDAHNPPGFFDEQHEEALAALAGLPPDQADAIRLLYLVAGNRQADVARLRGVTRQAVEQLVKRAKYNLRKRLADRGVLV